MFRYAIPVLLAAATLARAQDTDPHKMLHAFLLKEAQKHFDARRQLVAKLQKPEEIRKRQDDLKAKFIEALGGFPKRTPLNARVVGTLKGDGFRVEKVIYESRPEHHVTAVLYLPEGKGPFPGVLVPCGHSANGKAAEAYQRACILMAKNGLAVLCYDPIGQGERIQLLEKSLKPSIPGSTSEHTLAGIGALLVGGSTATFRIWDGMRSLDYLASRPEVDAKRLGCTGNSGGGTLTAYLMALDDRIACAAPSCYITTLERLFATLGPQDAEQNITGQVAFGMDITDYVTMRAPRPTLICTGTQDFFDIQGSYTVFREANLLYGKLGHGERVGIFEFDDKHGFSKPRREAAMRWMRRWLLHIDDAPTEPSFPVFTDAQLQCTRSGQVLEDFHGKSVFRLNAEAAKQYAPERAKFVQLPEADRRAGIVRLLGNGRTAGVSRLVQEPSQQKSGILETEPGIRLPIAVMGKSDGKRETLILSDRGLADDLQRFKKMYPEGHTTAIDLRGFGETAPKAVAKSNLLGGDWQHAFLSLHLNRPLLGQRVQDALAVLKTMPGDAEVDLIGIGQAGIVALHIAALDPRIRSLTLEDTLVSWTNVVQTPLSRQQLASVVPGVLKVYDLPELAATLAPRSLTIRNPLDAAGQPVSQADLDAVYAPCRAAYEKRGASEKLALQGMR